MASEAAEELDGGVMKSKLTSSGSSLGRAPAGTPDSNECFTLALQSIALLLNLEILCHQLSHFLRTGDGEENILREREINYAVS